MESSYKKEEDGTITMTVKFKLEGNLLDQETTLQGYLQEAGRMALSESLKELDTEGQPIVVNNERYTSRGQEKKNTNGLWAD